MIVPTGERLLAPSTFCQRGVAVDATLSAQLPVVPFQMKLLYPRSRSAPISGAV